MYMSLGPPTGVWGTYHWECLQKKSPSPKSYQLPIALQYGLGNGDHSPIYARILTGLTGYVELSHERNLQEGDRQTDR